MTSAAFCILYQVKWPHWALVSVTLVIKPRKSVETPHVRSFLFCTLQRILVDWNAIVYGSVGGAVGVIFGLVFVAPSVPPAAAKMGFVSIWLAFAGSLFWVNMWRSRHVFLTIPNVNWWKIIVLFLSGIIGGIMTSLCGVGLDIMLFAIVTLLFRVTEKVATPTSVVLMAINTVVGFFVKHFWLGGMEQLAWEYFACAAATCCIFGALGAWASSYVHRHVLAFLVYVLDIIQVARWSV